FESIGVRQRVVDKALDPVVVVRMHFKFKVSLSPLVQADAVVHERHSVRIMTLAPRAQYTDEVRREVQHLPEFLVSLAQRPREVILLGDIDPYSDAVSMANGSVRTYDPPGGVELRFKQICVSVDFDHW